MERILFILIIVFGCLFILRICKEITEENHKFILNIALIVYIFVTLWFTLFSRKMSQDIELRFDIFWTYRNTIRNFPIAIYHILRSDFSHANELYYGYLGSFDSLALNILLFIPVGYLLPGILIKRRTWQREAVVIGFMTSLCIEGIQLVTHLGCFDVDDILNNVVGTVLGVQLYRRYLQVKYYVKDETVDGMNIHSFNATEQAVLTLISNALFDTNLPLPTEIDWRSVYTECVSQAVLLLCFCKITKLPSDIEAEVQKHCSVGLALNLRNEYDHVQINGLIASFPYVILKGAASGFYYPDSSVRSTGDVDFLVRRDDAEAIDCILVSNGFKPVEKNKRNSHQIAYNKDITKVEMHQEVNGVPENGCADKIRAYFDDIFAQARTVESHYGSYVIPSDLHHGLILLLHTIHHMLTSGIGLRHLCDWAVFVNRTRDFPELFEDKLRAVGLWRFAQLLTQTSYFIGLPKKGWAGEDEYDLSKQLLSDIFAGGNFGIKDADRANAGKLIASRGNVYSDISSLKQLITSVNDIVRYYWPATIKSRVLYPFGWLWFGGKHLYRIAIGKRPKIDIKDMLTEADQRRSIYQKMKLFERESE